MVARLQNNTLLRKTRLLRSCYSERIGLLSCERGDAAPQQSDLP